MKLKHRAWFGAAVLLAGCASLPDSGRPADSATAPPAQAQSSDPAELAAFHLDQASRSTGLDRVAPLEQACWHAARAENPDLLQQALDLYPQATLSAEQKSSYDAYVALLHAMRGQAREALSTVATSRKPERANPLSDYWLAQALAYQQLDDGEAATLMLVFRARQLDETLQDSNNERIWTLQLEASRFLFSDEASRYDPITQGWLELGQIARQYWTDELGLRQALNDWSSRYAAHPANPAYLTVAGELATSTLRSAARRIALLLPLSGRLGSAASAVRDGFLAAHFSGTAQGLKIRIYDTSENAVTAFEQAQADGAQLVIGPLDKQQVEAVIARNTQQLPMLALNYRDAELAQPGLLEFGLSPEDDARSVALHALDQGLTHAIALVSEDDWGQRSLQAFADAFSAGGGVVVDQAQFHGGPRDYPVVIKDLLRLDESQSRAKAMQRLLGEELDSVPVRRQDAQFLFLAANAAQGRQLRPQFRFYHATDLPIYAAGRIYEGRANPRQDKDLNGIRFCAMPWLLNSSETWQSRRAMIEQAWPARSNRLERLYALGNDAYLVASALRNARWDQLPEINGATGALTRDGQRIVRTLPCARFEQGHAQIAGLP